MREIGPEEIAALVAAVMALVVWSFRLRGQNAWNREMKRRREDREARERGEGPPPPPRNPTGPWG